MFSVSPLRGGLPGPRLSGAFPTLALTPHCGLDVATVPYKPQCAAGAGAGPGWAGGGGCRREDPRHQEPGRRRGLAGQTWPREGLGRTRDRGPAADGGLWGELPVVLRLEASPLCTSSLLRGSLGCGQGQRKRE